MRYLENNDDYISLPMKAKSVADQMVEYHTENTLRRVVAICA